MGFNVNYDEAKNTNIIPEGEYEVVIREAKISTNSNNKEYIDVPMIVRNDVEQKYQNGYIWHALWKRKTPSAADEAVGGYSNYEIQALSKAVKFNNGDTFNSLDEWMDKLAGRTLRVIIKHEEYNGKTQAKVRSVSETQYPEYRHVFKSKSSAVDDDKPRFEELGKDDDLPF